MNKATVERMSECPIEKLFVRSSISYSEADIAEAISTTKEYLTTGVLSTRIKVAKQNSGRYEVLTNVGSFFAAHLLGLKAVTIVEDV